MTERTTLNLERDLNKIRHNIKQNGESFDIHNKDDCGRNYLQKAVFLKSWQLVQYFIDQGIDVNDSDNEKLTPLHRACRYGTPLLVTMLLRGGADCNAKANHSITPLHIAAYYGHANCVQNLCSEPISPDTSISSNNNLNNNNDDINFCSNKIIDLDAKDDEDHTPLHYAAAEGDIEVARELIMAGCDLSIPNVAGNTPLHFAAASGTPTLCQLFCPHKRVDIDAQNFKGQTPLHLAILQACRGTVKMLLNLGADPNIRDMKGNTGLHLAFKNGQIDLAKTLLLDRKIDPSISDDDENTALHLALKSGHFNMIPMMLPLASDLTKQNAGGCTIIIEAIKNYLEDLAIDMLKACPELVHKATLDLVTPLHLAAERGMTLLTKELLIAGAHVDATDSGGLTPSLYCAKNDSVLECLAMIEDLMMVSETTNHQTEDNGHQTNVGKGNGSKISRISS